MLTYGIIGNLGPVEIILLFTLSLFLIYKFAIPRGIISPVIIGILLISASVFGAYVSGYMSVEAESTAMINENRGSEEMAYANAIKAGSGILGILGLILVVYGFVNNKNRKNTAVNEIQAAAKYCPKCGKNVESESSLFCSECGQHLNL